GAAREHGENVPRTLGRLHDNKEDDSHRPARRWDRRALRLRCAGPSQADRLIHQSLLLSARPFRSRLAGRQHTRSLRALCADRRRTDHRIHGALRLGANTRACPSEQPKEAMALEAHIEGWFPLYAEEQRRFDLDEDAESRSEVSASSPMQSPA